MTKLMEGVYAVPRGGIPATWDFFRMEATDNGEGGETIQPLKHVCERSDDPTQENPTEIVVLSNVTWSFDKGFYYCRGCKEVFDHEDDLVKIWEDGLGTGHEGIA